MVNIMAVLSHTHQINVDAGRNKTSCPHIQNTLSTLFFKMNSKASGSKQSESNMTGDYGECGRVRSHI